MLADKIGKNVQMKVEIVILDKEVKIILSDMVMTAVGHNLKAMVAKNVVQLVDGVFVIFSHQAQRYVNGNHFNIIFINYNNYYI